MSQKDYDWLGHGIYFWENNYERALEWAKDKKKRGTLKTPSVIGAILHLGHCCDLTDRSSINMVKSHFPLLKNDYNKFGGNLPVNRDTSFDKHKDLLLRELDCTLLEYMHGNILAGYKFDIATKGFSEYKVFDSTRGIFLEGGPVYNGAGIFEKSHIQIAIRNSNCIKGFFIPRKRIRWPA